MKTIEAYETADGKLFTDEDVATAHDTDLLGEQLDGLLRLGALGGTSRRQEMLFIIRLMADKTALRKYLVEAVRILDHNDVQS